MTYVNFFIRVLLVLSLSFVSVNFVSCSDDEKIEVPDNPDPEPEPEPEPEPDDSESLAGDDFYMFVNEKWHESMANADKNSIHGYDADAENKVTERLEIIKGKMEEYKQLNKAIANLENQEEAAVALAGKITKDLFGKVKTKKELYIALGKAIRMGLQPVGSLNVSISTEDNTIGYTISFGNIGEEEEEASAEQKSPYAPDVVFIKKGKRYSAGTRGGETAMNYILQGVGLDTEYYLHDEDLDPILEAFDQVPVKDMINAFKEGVATYLLMYCSDEYVEDITGGQVETVAEYIDSSIEEDLGYFTSYNFAKEYIPEDTKTYFKKLGDEIKESFRKRIENNSWLSSATKAKAIEKLDYMKMSYGTPEKWLDVEAPKLGGELLLADVMTIKESRTKIIETLIGKAFDEYQPLFHMFNGETPLYTYTDNAVYNIATNSFYIMGPYMSDPIYRKDMSEVEIYAAIGSTIGHEMTHGFDKDGALFNKYGNEEDWWTAADKSKFDELNNLMAAQISTFEIIPGTKANGQNTVTEDVADLGGFLIGYDLWVKKLEEKGVTGDKLIAEKKKYFVHYAEIFRAIYPTDYIIEEVVPDVHSINHIRVNGIVQHVDDWYELYNVTKDKKLYLAPEKRITIW